MTIPNHYIEKIRVVYPNLSLDYLELNQDGMNNDVVIVNHQLVCRFPKNDWAKEDLKTEVKILRVAQQFIDLPIPRLEHVEDDFVSYPLIRGTALSRHQLFKLDSLAQERVIEQLGRFYQQLHSISSDAIAASSIPASIAERSREDMLALYEQVQQLLFPHLWKHQRTWVHEHFEPLVDGTLNLDTSTALIHGDLGCYHILFDPERQCLSGIIDFGTAGIGNPAIDLAALLDNHGEAVLKRMSKYCSGIEVLIDQARFRAGVVWLQWALMGLQHKDTGLLLAHIGSSARDIQPIGASW
ncbi:phosphotransferase [Kovacikia minuta CCNUW1]|uniref:phosphotransferase n=1 Tax=Kovacikia minuta TaxID=2931930 RepID=UPI001CCD976A|nr:phosphotransferase [Kovacikia minuta]UBF26212.1 phosphotransferase [Kovacikia minuta CCNUW1]